MQKCPLGSELTVQSVQVLLKLYLSGVKRTAFKSFNNLYTYGVQQHGHI